MMGAFANSRVLGADDMIADGNIRCSEFADILATRDDHYPLSDRYVEEVHDSPDKTGDTEREHAVSWFRASETKGSGGYTRMAPNYSAMNCYNNAKNAAMLLWIAEAVGVPADQVERAYGAAAEAGTGSARDARGYRGQTACRALREKIPWECIYRHATGLL